MPQKCTGKSPPHVPDCSRVTLPKKEPVDPLRIVLLGGFEVYSAAGKPINLPSRKAKGLLAYLAMSDGRAHARDKLAALFWEASGAKQARASLRQTLSRLRKLLNAGNGEVLVVDGDSIALNPAGVEVDAMRFERLLNVGTPKALEEASALYRGNFLEGFSLLADPFEEWLMAERMRLHEMVESALTRLLAHYRRVHATEDAVRVAVQLLTLDPLQESVHRLLMQLYIERGRPRSALKQYELCRELLLRELGIEPEAETRRLAAQLGAEQPIRIATRSVSSHSPIQENQRQFIPGPSEEGLQGASVSLQEQAAPAYETEQRFLTLMLCELVDAAELSTNLDPEDLREVIAAFENTCEQIVNPLGGQVVRLMGHSISVYFGYPQADEHDAERTVRAALEISAAVGQLSFSSDFKLQTRISIASGRVVVSKRVRKDGMTEEAITGEIPHVVTALQTVAEPDTILITESTKALLGALFEYKELGKRKLDGFDTPLQIWRVIRERPVQDRFEATRATSGLTPLVGREEEIALLMRRWQRANVGAGQIVVVAGEPGIGKSRLIQALREQLAGEPHKPVSFFCSPYHQESALFPVIRQLEHAASFAREDPPTVRLDKLEALLTQATDDLTNVVPFIGALLSVPTETRYPALNLTPLRQKAKTLEVLESQLTGLAKRQPILMIFENLHWSDPTTRDLVGRLVELVQALPVLIIITHRPGMAMPWMGEPNVTSVVLKRLSRHESETLVAELTHGKDLPQDVLAQIVSKGDGIPLFLEELTKNMLEAGVLNDQGDRYTLKRSLAAVGIPNTLYDLLLARLDRLGPAKAVAQQAAVIGRRFSYALLSAVALLEERALLTALAKLTDAELVYAHGVPPQASYSFKHALVQDAAYASLLRADRETLHARIARTLEEQFPETKETEPEVLAYHYAGAGLKPQAVSYWQFAGERAVQRSSNIEAIAYFTKALDLLRTLPQTAENREQELKLQIPLGRAWILTEGYAAPEVESAYARARDLCEQIGDVYQLFLVLLGLWQMYISRQELQLASNTGERLLPLARSQKNSDFALEAYVAQSITLHVQGAFDEALAHANEAIILYDPKEHRGHALRFGQDTSVIGRIMSSWPLWCLGYSDQALSKMREALGIARELAHPYSRAMALYCSAWLHQYRREVDAARKHAEQAMMLSSEQGFAWPLAFATILHGWALAEGGEIKSGAGEIREGLATLEKMGVRLWQPHMQAILATACVRAGQADEAFALLTHALDTTSRTGEQEYLAELYRQMGEVALQRAADQASAEAEACFSQAIEIARRQQAKSWELRAAVNLAWLWHDQGKSDQACGMLVPVYDWFTEGFDTPDLQDAKALLETLGLSPGHSARGQKTRG